MRHALAVILLFVVGSAQAATVTIDFEEFTVGDTGSLTSQGYTVIGDAYGLEYAGIALDDSESSKVYLAAGETPDGFLKIAVVQVSRDDGNAFSLWSADWLGFVNLAGAFSPAYNDSFVRGELANGDTIDAYSSAELGQGDWLNIVSASFFAETTAVNPIAGVAVQVDNIVVGAAVPIPAAVWLFGSGLGLLGFLRRRRLS